MTTIVQVYAPTDAALDSDKDVFYHQLDAVKDFILSYDMKILMGDFNAQIGPDITGFENVIGKEAERHVTPKDHQTRDPIIFETPCLSNGAR